jgi:hypothetical protein
MRCRALGFWSLALSTAGILLVAASTSVAQTTTNNNGSNTSNQPNANGSGLTAAGIAIDTEGVLRVKTFGDPGGQLMRERIAAAKANLGPKLASYSKMRKVSLNRLEQAILDHQNTLTDEMRYLAGLQRVRYVFYYPESKDIVLAGQAEGWAADASGRIVGIGTGRPVVQLQDLVAALRAFPPSGDKTTMIGCSIDPTPEGQVALRQFIGGIRLIGPPNAAEIQSIAEGVRNSLGYQIVTIDGVSPKSHYAQVMVEADYRMKLIGIGLERPPVRLASYVDHAKIGEVSRNALQRWFFVPDYKCVCQSDDKLAMELVGDGVKLVGEDEVVMSNGERRASAGRQSKASQMFTINFTKKYADLAERSPVYAELRNLIDLAIAAAYIQEQDYYAKAGWKMPFFGSEQEFPVEVYSIPKTVESAVNAIWKGHTLATPVGGGVTIAATEALKSDNVLSDKKGTVAKTREGVKLNLAKGQWWWD